MKAKKQATFNDVEEHKQFDASVEYGEGIHGELRVGFSGWINDILRDQRNKMRLGKNIAVYINILAIRT